MIMFFMKKSKVPIPQCTDRLQVKVMLSKSVVVIIKNMQKADYEEWCVSSTISLFLEDFHNLVNDVHLGFSYDRISNGCLLISFKCL